MAFATISVSNGVEIKQAPIGFSWTTFLFGGWPAVFRQDWLMAAIIMVVYTVRPILHSRYVTVGRC